jgi:hypothetical protein
MRARSKSVKDGHRDVARAMAVILSRPLITVAGLARPEMLVEVQGIAVLG